MKIGPARVQPSGRRLTRTLVAAAGMLGGVLTPVVAPAAVSRPGGPPIQMPHQRFRLAQPG